LSHEVAFTTQDGPSQLTNNGLAETSCAGENESDPTARDQVLFKNDQIYRHHLARFNYTTYDVRRAQDVVNPNTPHRDIMLLANPDDLEANSNHPFLYARVLGIYHANVVYVGPGMRDYVPRRLEFLWVRWFQYFGSRSVIWKDCRLDCVRFPPMASEHAFGFVDPRDVLRGCHVMQRFAKGTVHADVIGLSRLVDDSTDWCFYYVNRCDHGLSLHLIIGILTPQFYRFVDRDMIMRYHWGLAVGHVYTHGQTSRKTPRYSSSTVYNQDLEVTGSTPGSSSAATATSQDFNGESDIDGPDSGLGDEDDDDWEDVDRFRDDDEQAFDDFSDDDMAAAMDNMYGVS
jgi:hypothetical protein